MNHKCNAHNSYRKHRLMLPHEHDTHFCIACCMRKEKNVRLKKCSVENMVECVCTAIMCLDCSLLAFSVENISIIYWYNNIYSVDERMDREAQHKLLEIFASRLIPRRSRPLDCSLSQLRTFFPSKWFTAGICIHMTLPEWGTRRELAPLRKFRALPWSIDRILWSTQFWSFPSGTSGIQWILALSKDPVLTNDYSDSPV